jgi:hypothetical protein
VVLSRKPSPFSAPPYWSHFGPVSRGEEIPQLNAIMPPIPGNVHGASLKRSELI